METKKCPCCGKTKSYSEFYKNSSRKDGLTTYCKACIKIQSADYHKRNKEKCQERLQNWRKNNPEKFKEQNKKWRENNPDKEFAKQKRYRESHKEQLYIKGKKYRANNKEYFYEKARIRKEAQKEASDGTVTNAFKQLLYKQQDKKCAYCGCDLEKTGKHLDHIVPISKGGKHTASNVHWVCPTCNMSKSDRLESEWEATKEYIK